MRSSGAQCALAHAAPDGAEYIRNLKAINMMLLRSKSLATNEADFQAGLSDNLPESEQAGYKQQRGDRARQKTQTNHDAELHVGSNFRQHQHRKSGCDRSGAD